MQRLHVMQIKKALGLLKTTEAQPSQSVKIG